MISFDINWKISEAIINCDLNWQMANDLIYLPTDHHVGHFIVRAHRKYKISGFWLRFSHQERAVFATLQKQLFALLSRQITVEPSANIDKHWDFFLIFSYCVQLIMLINLIFSLKLTLFVQRREINEIEWKIKVWKWINWD